jgi:hypothetical protein
MGRNRLAKRFVVPNWEVQEPPATHALLQQIRRHLAAMAERPRREAPASIRRAHRDHRYLRRRGRHQGIRDVVPRPVVDHVRMPLGPVQAKLNVKNAGALDEIDPSGEVQRVR